MQRILRLAFFISLALGSTHGRSQSLENFDPSRILVKLQSGVQINEVTELKAKQLLDNYYVVQTGGESAEDLVELFSQDERVANVSLNYKHQVEDVRPSPTSAKGLLKFLNEPSFFNDAKASQLWGFASKEENGIDVNGYYELTSGPGSNKKSPVIVAVVDTGSDLSHPDLAGKFWTNTKEIAGNKLDDDKNGYVDDVYGINTLKRNAQGEATADVTLDSCRGFFCASSHGTHVAGTIAAVQNNAIGVAGISSDAKIMTIKTVPSNGSDETDVDVAESYAYAAKNGARVINCSFGKKVNEGGNIVNEMITTIAEKYNVLVVIAAGNDSGMDIDTSLRYPASYENPYTLVIGASSSNGTRASFSNIGKKNVDLFAPGADIVSTVKDGYEAYDGTSMATPHVAGVAAEILSQFPKLTVKELKQVILKSVVKVPAYSSISVSGGLLNLKAAYEYADAKFNHRR
jgi:thermitase